jgi:DNA-binding NarL/FixJ family response regulator
MVAVISVLVVEDQMLVRQGIRSLLALVPAIAIAGEASCGEQALAMIRELMPDVVLLDLKMPRVDGLEVLRRLQQEPAAPPVLVLTTFDDTELLLAAIRSGARGYLLKDQVDSDLIAAVRAVARGEGYLSPAVSDAVLNDYRRHVSDPIDLLTSREREVLQMIAEGKTNKEIATVLNLSVYTVDAHRGRIMEKLNLHSVNELVRFAVRQGLVD